MGEYFFYYLFLIECIQTVLKMIVWWERKEGGRGIRGGGVDRRANSGAVVAVSEMYHVSRIKGKLKLRTTSAEMKSQNT